MGNIIANSFAEAAAVSVFRLDDMPRGQAAALNEDGTVNSPRNPAKAGSRVALFGTGGGATIPPSVAGEVTPLEIRVLENVQTVTIADGPPLTVEFAGAAPGLVAGVTQINVKLPDVFPRIGGYPPGTLPLRVGTPMFTFTPGTVTIAVEPE